MTEQVECPCCSHRADVEIDYSEPEQSNQRIREALREHVLWTHYRTGDWGYAPSGMQASMLFLALGVLDREEAERAADAAFLKETPRPGWLKRHGRAWIVAACWFLWGSVETYIWIRDDAWWAWALAASLALAVFPTVSYLGYRRVWRGHPSERQLRQHEQQAAAYVPDTIPEDFDAG